MSEFVVEHPFCTYDSCMSMTIVIGSGSAGKSDPSFPMISWSDPRHD